MKIWNALENQHLTAGSNYGLFFSVFATLAACSSSVRVTPPAAQGLSKVNHIIVVMMENHSFDNYFGALPYVPGGPYHRSSSGCVPDDHRCVDGLSCTSSSTGNLTCMNSNPEDAGPAATAFHNPSRCVIPDTQADLPFYYDLAQKFAIDDRYFASVIGPTLPNRFYLMAATSFGHVSTGDVNFPPDGLKPSTGTILDLLDSRGISWTDYYEVSPQVGAFRRPSDTTDPHFGSVEDFLTVAAGFSGAATLPQVSFLDARDDEHPPEDIQRGQAFVSRPEPGRSVPQRLRRLRSTRLPRSVPDRLAVRQSALCLAHGRRPRIDSRVH